MKKQLLLAGLLLCGFAATSQNPGNVGTGNLTAWFLPDALPNGAVQNWSTTFPTGGAQITVTDASAPYPTATNTPVGDVANYNTTLEFQSNSLGALKAFENTDALNLLQNNGASAQGTFFCAYYKPQAGQNDHMLLWNNTPHAIQFRNLNNNGRLAIGRSPSNSTNASRDWTEDFKPTIISYKGNRQTSTSMSSYERGVLFPVNTASQSSGPQGLYMGYYPGNANSPYDGYIHEYIFYDRDLSALEMQKVHTYLAVKYGVTLDYMGGTIGDYVATDGTLLWDASSTPAYHNNVIGIGRDDAQGLSQKQSHAFDDSYRLYLSNLAPNNVSNSGLFLSDVSYVMMGQINQNGCATASSNQEAPAGIQSRIAKEWKVTKTNFDQTFSVDLLIDTCTAPGASNGTIVPSQFKLLVDDDGNFSNATVLDATSGLTFTMNGSYLTISGISSLHLANNATSYITVGYNTVEAYFDGPNEMCEGDSVLLELNVLYTLVPTAITYTDGTNTYTLTNVVHGDSIYVSPNSTTTYTVMGVTNFLDCCGGPHSNAKTVTVHANPNVDAHASDSSICLGDSTQLYGTGADNYVWSNNIQDQSYIHPTSTDTYSVVGTNLNGCVDSSSVQVEVNPLPVVTASADTTIICFGESVVLTADGATMYAWSHGQGNGSTLSPNATTTYQVIGTNTFGCTDEASIQIQVLDLPEVVANVADSGVCAGDSTFLFGSGAIQYQWSDGQTDLAYFFPTDSRWYTVLGTDANNCQNEDSVFVTFYPVVDFYLGADTAICPQDPLFLEANQTFAWYEWSTGSNSTKIVVNSNEHIFLTVYDEFGCDYSDDQIITLSEDCMPAIYVPNAFTPDGNAHNQYFRTTGVDVAEFKIEIYNRWGELLFVSENIDHHWDGTYGNQICPTGLYTYILTYSLDFDSSEYFQKTGSFHLLR